MGFASKPGGIVLSFFFTSTIPQSPSVTAPFTQGSLRCGGNCAKRTLFGFTGTAGGFHDTKNLGGAFKGMLLPFFMQR